MLDVGLSSFKESVFITTALNIEKLVPFHEQKLIFIFWDGKKAYLVQVDLLIKSKTVICIISFQFELVRNVWAYF